MANVDKPFGMRALGNLSATGAQKQYAYRIATNQAGAIFQGDLVTVFDGSLVRFNPATHDAAVGVFNGCNYIDPSSGKPTWKNFYPGSVNVTQGIIEANVIDDPSQLFVIQASVKVLQTQIGFNADVVMGTGNSVTGVSGMELSSATIAKAADLNLKIVGYYEDPNNLKTEDNVLVVVKINEHLYGSAGVAGQGA